MNATKKYLYAHTLLRAADMAGSVDELARQLRVRAEFIELWIEGKGMAPRDVFLRAVDMLNQPELSEFVKASRWRFVNRRTTDRRRSPRRTASRR